MLITLVEVWVQMERKIRLHWRQKWAVVGEMGAPKGTGTPINNIGALVGLSMGSLEHI